MRKVGRKRGGEGVRGKMGGDMEKGARDRRRVGEREGDRERDVEKEG